MITIWKFALEITDEQVVMLPEFAKVLSTDIQGGGLHIWAMVDSKRPLIARKVRIVGTGHPISFLPERFHFAGSAQLAGGSLVFHIFVEVT